MSNNKPEWVKMTLMLLIQVCVKTPHFKEVLRKVTAKKVVKSYLQHALRSELPNPLLQWHTTRTMFQKLVIWAKQRVEIQNRFKKMLA